MHCSKCTAVYSNARQKQSAAAMSTRSSNARYSNVPPVIYSSNAQQPQCTDSNNADNSQQQRHQRFVWRRYLEQHSGRPSETSKLVSMGPKPRARPQQLCMRVPIPAHAAAVYYPTLLKKLLIFLAGSSSYSYVGQGVSYTFFQAEQTIFLNFRTKFRKNFFQVEKKCFHQFRIQKKKSRRRKKVIKSPKLVS